MTQVTTPDGRTLTHLEDDRVPPYINRTFADRMPNVVWHGIEGGGHFIAIGAIDAILAAAAGDLGA